MPRILSVVTQTPEHCYSQESVCNDLCEHLRKQDDSLDLSLVRKVFSNSNIERRNFLMPLDWYYSSHTLAEQNAIFMEKGLKLLKEASEKSLKYSQIPREKISHLIFATTTGFSTPSLDAYLINAINLPKNISRLPIWGLGCGAGASGIARAYDYCLAHPEAVVLFVDFEACTINYMPDDNSKKNIIAISLFSDCAAAVVIAGDKVKSPDVMYPEILASDSYLSPETTNIAGWDVTDRGFKLVLSPELPEIAKKELPILFSHFLDKHGVNRSELVHFLFHPGSAKVMKSIKESLHLSDLELNESNEVLREFGNISSVSVLAVIEKWLLTDLKMKPGYGIIVAFGPGYSTEFILVKI